MNTPRPSRNWFDIAVLTALIDPPNGRRIEVAILILVEFAGRRRSRDLACPLDRIAWSQPDLADSYSILDDRWRLYYEHLMAT